MKNRRLLCLLLVAVSAAIDIRFTEHFSTGMPTSWSDFNQLRLEGCHVAVS